VISSYARIDVFRKLVFFYFFLISQSVFSAIPLAPLDASEAIQQALDSNGEVQIPVGTYVLGKTIRIGSGAKLEGAGKGRTILILKSSVNDDMIRTDNFQMLSGGDGISKSPSDFHISGITLNGNYLDSKWNSNTNRVNNSKGSCLKLYGRRFFIDVEANNCAEHALYSEGQGPRNGEEVASTIKIFGTTFGKEALVFRGPGDILIDYAVLGLAGILPKPAQLSSRNSSLLFRDSDAIDGVVIDRTPPYEGTVEIGFMHVYATWNGFGLRTRGNPRVQIRQLISESNLGGVAISRNSWGGVGMLDIHSNGKNAPGMVSNVPSPREGLLSESLGPFYISGGLINRTVGSGEGWVAARVSGGNQIINLLVKGNVNPDTKELYSGDAIVVEGSGNVINVSTSRVNGRAISVSGVNNQVRAVVGDQSNDCYISSPKNQVSIVGGGTTCRY